MLLRSVGQEEKIVEETVIQHLDLCNEPGSLTKVMDPTLNQESQKAQISSGELESVVENDNLYVIEAKLDNTFDDATQMDAKNAENESMDKKLLEEPSVTAVENPSSAENVGASIVELRGLENMQQVAVNASGLSENFSSGAAEHAIQSKQISIDVPDVKAFQKPSSETSNPFSGNPSQMIKSEDPDSQESNVGLMSNLSTIKNYSVDENETTIGKASQQVTSDPSLLSADNMYEMAGERSIEKDAHAGDSEPGAIHVYQGDSFTKKEDASLPVESSERDVEVVPLDSQTNVEPSLSVEGSKENTGISHTFASDAAVQVEQVAAMESDNKETDDQLKSPILGVSLVHQDNKETMENDGILQVESAVASGLRNPSFIVRNEASTDLVEKVVLGIDGHCVKPFESRNTSQSEQEPESNSGGQECIKRLESLCELSEKNGNNSQARGLHDPKESMVEVNKTIEHQTSADVVRPSDFKLKGKQEVTKDVRHGIATQEGKNFSFEVDGSAGLAQDGKGFQSYPTFQVSNLPKILDSSSSHVDATKLREVPHSPQNTSGLTAQTGVKGKAERKPRRKSVPKENARKSLSLTSPATIGFLSSAKLPDSNNTPSIFQQPFTDSQQVQLRAQILVYGSVISGSPPEEPHMLAAFGQSDGGRIWEGVWRAYLERLHVRKAQAKSNIPLQTRSDLRDAGNKADQGAKHASVQTKIPSSSIGVMGNKATPPKFSSMIPDSSSLWNISTPSEYRHPYQTPPVQQSFIAHNNPSWLSQGPFAGQWLPPYNTTPTFPAFPVTEAVKLTPVKELAGSGIKTTSTLTVLNSASTIFPEASSGDLKSRKRKKSSPVVSNTFSTSDAVSVPALIISKNIPAKFLSAVSPIHDPNKVKVVISEETLIKVEESKLQSEDATKHAAVAVNHCLSVWSQLETQNNSALSSDKEAKLVSSAVSIAAAASVAKVAAAAAKIASDFAEHARSMVNGASLSSSKHAENLNAVVKAAELAAEAVSQAGKIVATSEPMPLLDLVKAGSEGYWKTPRLASKQQPNLNGNDKKIVESAPEVSEKEILNTKSGLSRNENIEYVSVEGTSLPFTTHEKSKRKPRVRKGPHLAKTIGVVPELEIGSINTSVGQAHPKASTGLKENIIEEGCLVEVRKNGDTYDGAWFGANVLSVKDGKALVCYTDIKSDEGSGKLKEWVPLEVGAAEVPKIRSPHPVTTRRLEGTRKRSRTTSTDYVWSSGDVVDVWIQDRWREGVIMEINKMDVTSLTVNFPAQGVTSLVRSWFVRPTLVWKDGKWVESHTSEKHFSSQEDRPQEKRLKLGSHIVESKTNKTSSQNIDLVDPQKQEEPKTLSLSTHESVFNIGTIKDNKKVTAQRTIRSGLQKEGPRVIFGVPKPGKKQKFMDIGSSLANKNNRSHDSIKFTKYLIPQAPGSRGWKNSSRDPKEKQATEIKPRMMSRKPPVPSRPFASSKSTTVDTNTINETNPDCVIDGENQSGHQNTDIEDEPRHEDLISSLANSQPSKGASTSSTKSDHSRKRKFVPTVEKLAKIKKSLPEVVETRRSNRKIQPTSRLLEGLQSSMAISKTPASSHSTRRNHSKLTPKGVRKTKATGSPRSKWITKDMKSGVEVLNPMPVSHFDPNTGDVVKSGIGMKPGSVKYGDKSAVEKDKAPVVEKDKVLSVNEKSKPPVIDKSKAPAVVKSAVEKDKMPVVEKDKVPSVIKKSKSSAFEKAKAPAVEKDKPADVNAKSAPTIEKPKAPAVEKLKAPIIEKPKLTTVENDKVVSSKAKAPAVVKDTSVVKDKVVGDKSVVVKFKDKASGNVAKGKKVAVVKDTLSEVNVKSKDKASEVKVLSEGVKRKRLIAEADESRKEMKVKHLKDDRDIEHSGFKGDKKVKVDQKGKKSKVKVDHSDDEVDRKTKKSKRKRNYSDSDSSSFDEEKARRVYKALKKVKKEESDEENVPRRGKKNEKKLTREEIEEEEYLKNFPTMRARTVPRSFFSAIREARVDMRTFLSEIGFSSFHNIPIEKVPSRLGRYVVQNFNPESFLLRLDTGDSIKVTHSKIHEILGIPIGGDSLFSLDLRPIEHEFVRLWVAQFFPKSLKDIRVGDIASVLISAQEVDFLFKVNFLTLFTNTMGMVAGLKGQICLDVVRRLCEETIISNIDWCDYIHHCLQYSEMPDKKTVQYLGPFLFLILLYLDSTKFEKFPYVRTRPAIRDWTSTLMRQRLDLELKERVVGLLEINKDWTEAECQETEGFTVGGSLGISEKEDLFKKVEEKLSIICAERNVLEDYLRKASLDYSADGKFVELREKYVEIFKKPISFNDDDNDGSSDGHGNDGDGNADDDDEDGNNGHGNDGDGNDDDDDEDGNNGSGDTEVNDKDPSDISKVCLEDFQNEPSRADENEAIVGEVIDSKDDENEDDSEEDVITSTPETYTQWLENNIDLVGEGAELDLEMHQRMEVVNDGPRMEVNDGPSTPERIPTRVLVISPIPEKRIVKPSSYLLSPFMNKKTIVIAKMTRSEFMLGTSLFAMQGETIEKVFETRSGNNVFSIRLNMETLAPGLWIDANVVDCWAAILNYEERFKEVDSPSRHFFPTGCITSAMFDGTLTTFAQKWESFSAQVTAQFEDNAGGLALEGIDLVFFPILESRHFYVVVFSITKTTSMTILDNSYGGATYEEKYEKTCELLKKLFARYLKLHNHKRHAMIRKLKPKIPRLKWRTNANFRDCGIFTMVHMELFMGGAVSKWDCGLPSESDAQRDMLRRLRFKYATKILLHELNVHAEKMIQLAHEFNKIEGHVKMSMIVEAAKNREQRERS